jgi:hypothetical protein
MGCCETFQERNPTASMHRHYLFSFGPAATLDISVCFQEYRVSTSYLFVL